MVAVGLEDGGLRLYGVPEGQVLGGVNDAHGSSGITRIAFNADGSLLATGGTDNKAKLWRVEGTGRQASSSPSYIPSKDHSNVVHAVAFSPDGRTLATAELRRQGRAVRRGERQGAFVRGP